MWESRTLRVITCRRARRALLIHLSSRNESCENNNMRIIVWVYICFHVIVFASVIVWGELMRSSVRTLRHVITLRSNSRVAIVRFFPEMSSFGLKILSGWIFLIWQKSGFFFYKWSFVVIPYKFNAFMTFLMFRFLRVTTANLSA